MTMLSRTRLRAADLLETVKQAISDILAIRNELYQVDAAFADLEASGRDADPNGGAGLSPEAQQLYDQAKLLWAGIKQIAYDNDLQSEKYLDTSDFKSQYYTVGALESS